MTQLEAQEEIIKALREDLRILRAKLNTSAPFPTCGICNKPLQFIKRMYDLSEPTSQRMTEYWDCVSCKKNPRLTP